MQTTNIPEKGQIYERVNPATQTKELVTATGTRREVKGVLYDFFTNEKGETLFFYPSEVAAFVRL